MRAKAKGITILKVAQHKLSASDDNGYSFLQVIGSPREYHFVHRSVPHARTRRSLSHMRSLKSHPEVSENILEGCAYDTMTFVLMNN